LLAAGDGALDCDAHVSVSERLVTDDGHEGREFVGMVTFSRTLQSGIEDYNYAHRIARLRGFYFQYAPELVDYLVSVPPQQRLTMQGLRGGPCRSL
jgi:hypothetical protein